MCEKFPKFFPENSIFRIILIEKNEYYLFYSHNFIPSLSKDNINTNIDLGNIILITKMKNSNNELIKYTNKNELTIKNTINESIFENDINILSKIICLLEGVDCNNSVINNLKIDLNENQLKIISTMNKGIKLILFKVDLISEKIDNYNIIFELGIEAFEKKKEIEKDFEKKLEIAKEKEEKLKMKENIIERDYNKKENKLLEFFCDELNKKKEIIRELDNQINNISSSPHSQIKEVEKENNNIEINNNNMNDINNVSNLNLSTLNRSINKQKSQDSPKSNKSNLSLSDLF
jgi:hypothetical protein